MDLRQLAKWAIVVAVAVVAWKYILPRIQARSGISPTASSAADPSCVRRAEAASEAWGRGLSRFVNPPYDLNAWSSFRSEVDAAVSSANAECGCAADSCEKARAAMRDLSALMSDFDGSIRNGSSLPGDVVQRQEGIDNAIETARELARSGK